MLNAIHRHPIKGLGGQRLERVALAPHRALPGDRAFALAHAKSKAGEDGAWMRCGHWARVASSPKLATVSAALGADGLLEVDLGGASPERIDPDDDAACAHLARALEALADPRQPPPYRLIRSKDGAMTDSQSQTVSIGNLATLRALERLEGAPLDPRRFRANFWIDVEPAFVERAWVGRAFRIGAVAFAGVENIERCAAITVDPDKGEADRDLLRLLKREWGHIDFALSAWVESAGTVAVGDPVVA